MFPTQTALALLVLVGCGDDTDTLTGTVDSATTGLTDTATVTDTSTPTDTEPTDGVDADQDGYTADQDCNDLDQDVYPGATELCNGADDDCDKVVDEPDAADAPTWYKDRDGDGYGDDDDTEIACNQPHGYSAYPGDCDDGDAAYHPGASESDCTDSHDYNCDGSVGYADDDKDGVPACEDCDDTSAYHYPGGPERCDGTDEDCDGDIDEDAIDAETWYGDADADGYGATTFTTVSCDTPLSSYVSNSEDCDDLDALTYPGATELCDETDNDCDSDVDEDATDTFWLDDDGDGYGDPDATTQACSVPAGYSANDDDCDDADPAAWPGGIEVCDGVDNDCDGDVDVGALDTETFYTDADRDSFGDPDAGEEGCEPESDQVENADDCDDGDAGVSPDAEEVCDGVDNNCDGDTDEDTATDAGTWYRDADADGFGDTTDSLATCSEPAGYVSDDTDCDDTDSASWPAAPETCDAVDNDCDGVTDEESTDATTWYTDADGDGYGDGDDSEESCDELTGTVEDGTDCDDGDASINPGELETWYDGVDADCDGASDYDQDGDGFDSDDYAGTDCDDEDVTLYEDCSLFEFSSHTFTNCGAAEREGPSLADCNAYYSTVWDEDSRYLTMDVQGIQLWTVPADGDYAVEAYGASSGENTDYTSYPGRGAYVYGEFTFVQGDVLQILVGQEGQTVNLHTGGGGGSFLVAEDDTPLLIAGGGGAACRDADTRSTTDATTSENGVSSTCSGGTGGDGGESCSGSYGSGGGGFSSDGEDGPGSSSGGRSFLNGGEGGNCDATCGSNAGAGGFGGGGGTYHDIYGGGGGGYSGGGGGEYCYGGGGGGSYNAGANTSSAASANTGDGTITITAL